jgi:3-oxoacyl-[acyl-carrier-protein] synthase-3
MPRDRESRSSPLRDREEYEYASMNRQPGDRDMPVYVSGVGSEIPERIVTSAEVEDRLDIRRFGLEPGWLQRVTGVRERRWADPATRPSELAAAAARRALADAGVGPDAVDVLIFAGITRDFIEPATANVVQDLVGARKARVFDVTNACNGVADALDVADALVTSGRARRVLIATGERATISANWTPATADEFFHSVAGFVVGDGGGALVVEASPDPDRGIRARAYRSDGSFWRLGTGGRLRPSDEACPHCGSLVDMPFVCDGRALFAAGIQLMVPTMVATMRQCGWRYEDLDVVFCHEASKRFVETGMSQLGEGEHPGPKIWSTIERYGNTSTVSLPLAMAEARAAGALMPGTKVLVLGGASGASMAAIAMAW